MMHLDLFSGIGGFAIAGDAVWPNAEHIFCDNDKFCQQILNKHWPNAKIYKDIKDITDANWNRLQKQRAQQQAGGDRQLSKVDILTGGFPCQPFSQAGRRRGTDDNRYLWPEMFRVIQLTKPRWIIAENVRGLLTIEGGLVFEQVCLDLEGEGYEVQPFIIPALAVNAPHRRDRVWIVANNGHQRLQGNERGKTLVKKEGTPRPTSELYWDKDWRKVAFATCDVRVDDGFPYWLYFLGRIGYNMRNESNTKSSNTKGLPAFTKSAWSEMRRMWEYRAPQSPSCSNGGKEFCYPLYEVPHQGTQTTWYWHMGQTEEEKELCHLWQDFYSAPFSKAQDLFLGMLERIRQIECDEKMVYTRNDKGMFKLWKKICVPKTEAENLRSELWKHLGLETQNDLRIEAPNFAGWTKAQHRVQRLKALGNAIVPQVAIEIMKAIKEADKPKLNKQGKRK